MLLHLQVLQVSLLLLPLHSSPASGCGFLAAAAADSLAAVAAVPQPPAAAGPCDPSSQAFVVGSWLALQAPIAGFLAEVVHLLPAELVGAAAELEVVTGTEDHLAAILLAFPVAVGLTESCQQLPEPGRACPGPLNVACPSGFGRFGGERVVVSCPLVQGVSELEPEPEPSVSVSPLGAGSSGPSPQQPEAAPAAGLVQALAPDLGWVVAAAGAE